VVRAVTTRPICKAKMSSNSYESPLVSAQWLQQTLRQGAHSLKLLDCSWYMPGSQASPRKDFEHFRLSGAQFFDIDEICDRNTTLPHMAPLHTEFAQQVALLGISNGDHVVCYDMAGLYMASARVWWMFRLFGHYKVSVLERGLVKGEWEDATDLISSEPPQPPTKGTFIVSHSQGTKLPLIKTLPQILVNLSSKEFRIVDARPQDRFNGVVAEPRPNLKRGHIPKSYNVPFTRVLVNRQILPQEKLKQVFLEAGVDLADPTPIVTSCGSGVTGAVLSLALSTIGKESAIYDGSWSEYGHLSANNPTDPSS